MTATPKSLKSESLNGSGSWIEINENNSDSPFHFMKNNGRESKNSSSFEKIMMDVQNELIQLNMSSNSSCKEQLQQMNQLSSKPCSDQLQVDAQQFKLDQLESFENERFQNLNSELYWYWEQDSDCKNFFDDKKTFRQWAIRRNIFSKEVLSLLVLSNVVSVVLGVGIGYTALIRRFL